MAPGSSTVAQELDSLLKHQVKITTSVKDSFGVALASDYTSAGFTTASVCSSECSWSYAGSSGLIAGSGHAVVYHLGKIWVIGGGNGSSVYSKVYSSSDGKTGTEAGASGDWSSRNNHAATAYGWELWDVGRCSNGASLLNDALNSS